MLPNVARLPRPIILPRDPRRVLNRHRVDDGTSRQSARSCTLSPRIAVGGFDELMPKAIANDILQRRLKLTGIAHPVDKPERPLPGV